MSLRIAYITDERFPFVGTDCQQMIKTADALGEVGCAVDFIPPRMAIHLFTGRAQRKQSITEYFNVDGNFEFRDILTWPASNLRIEKFFHGLAAPLKASFGNYDVIYTRNLLPLRLASVLGLPVIFETYRALPISDPSAWNTVKRSMGKKNFLGIVTHSEYSKGVMIEAGADESCISAIPNGFDPRDFEKAPDRSSARERLSIPDDSPVAVYTGHIRADKGIDSLVNLAADCPNYKFLIVGGSPSDTDNLQKLLDLQKVENTTLVGQVPISEVPLYLAAADVLILPPTAGPLMSAGNTVLPMKTFTYLAGGRPILAPDLPDTKGILIHDSNCLRVEPDNREAAAATLERLGLNRDLAIRLGKQALIDARRYTWNGRAKNLMDFMNLRLTHVTTKE
jgi:glycosyltransferase involved in cell wall biosynthesis